MCAPGGKAWTRRLHWAHCLLMVALWVWSAYLSLRRDIANVVAGVVVCETNYLLTGVIPAYAPSKFVLPPCPLLDAELSNVQHYVALLAAHDLETDCATAPFAVAAFDLASPSLPLVHSGCLDFAAFLSPAQQHVHALVLYAPVAWATLAWGTLLDSPALVPADTAPPPATFVISTGHAATPSPTIPTLWLATPPF